MALSPHLIAHRGFGARFPANTLAAFRGALAYADRLAGIEFDIQVTADGELIVLHDNQFIAASGQAIQVASLTLEELAAHPRVLEMTSGEPLPLLGEALSVIDHRATVYIELKEGAVPAERMLVPLRAALQAYGADASVVLMSFAWRWIEQAMAELELPVRYACLFGGAAQLAEIPATVVARCDFLQPNAQALLEDSSYLARWPQPLNPWTVNDGGMLARLVTAPWAERLHAITTDEPELAVES